MAKRIGSLLESTHAPSLAQRIDRAILSFHLVAQDVFFQSQAVSRMIVEHLPKLLARQIRVAKSTKGNELVAVRNDNYLVWMPVLGSAPRRDSTSHDQFPPPSTLESESTHGEQGFYA